MKVFISADMEGVTGTTQWEECNRNSPFYAKFAEQMTREVEAACKGAINAGAKEIVVKDSHSSATNIDITALPEGVKLIRNWSGHPYAMVDGIDSSFDAAIFIGYHAAAGRPGNPLSHTMSGVPYTIKINGQYASEFMLYSYAAVLEKVPTVFVSGDAMLCEDSKALHPKLKSVAVKSGKGNLTINESPASVIKWIESGVEIALNQDLSDALVTLPEHFTVEIAFKEHTIKTKKAFYPGMQEVDDLTLRFETDDYFEVLRMIAFVI
jgi:D-amino peptidase